MKLLKILGQVRHVIGALGGLALGMGMIEPATVEAINTAGDAVAGTVEVISTATYTIKDFIAAVGVIIAFLWSWFSPEKKLA